MMDELTAKMHSEFTIPKETEVKHKVWDLLLEAKRRRIAPSELLNIYGLSATELEMYNTLPLQNEVSGKSIH